MVLFTCNTLLISSIFLPVVKCKSQRPVVRSYHGGKRTFGKATRRIVMTPLGTEMHKYDTGESNEVLSYTYSFQWHVQNNVKYIWVFGFFSDVRFDTIFKLTRF